MHTSGNEITAGSASAEYLARKKPPVGSFALSIGIESQDDDSFAKAETILRKSGEFLTDLSDAGIDAGSLEFSEDGAGFFEGDIDEEFSNDLETDGPETDGLEGDEGLIEDVGKRIFARYHAPLRSFPNRR